MPEPDQFSSALSEATHQELGDLLGPVWSAINSRDLRGRRASPPNPRRHLLAVLYEHADTFAQQFPGVWPGFLPDYLAFHGLVSVLSRARAEPSFPELVTLLERPEGFRHTMVMLGFADHIRRHTQLPVRLPASGPAGQRVVDLLLGPEDGSHFQVETKTPAEFDGPLAPVTPANARGAIRRAWAKAVGGRRPQLPAERPGVLLLGGVTLKLESLPIIAQAATDWLSRRGEGHPNLWGIVVLTYWSYSVIPAGRRVGDGMPLTVNSHMGVQLRVAENPHYTGIPRIRLSPYALGD